MTKLFDGQFYHLVLPVLKILFDSNKLSLSQSPNHKILYKDLGPRMLLDDQIFVSLNCTSTVT